MATLRVESPSCRAEDVAVWGGGTSDDGRRHTTLATDGEYG